MEKPLLDNIVETQISNILLNIKILLFISMQLYKIKVYIHVFHLMKHLKYLSNTKFLLLKIIKKVYLGLILILLLLVNN
jgi:hypothetical protein